MFVYNKISPTYLNFQSTQPGPDLYAVSLSLKERASPRRYSPISYVSDCGSSASATPPLHELQFLRTLCRREDKEERRISIPEWTYWRTEARFFAERVKGGETERQSLQDSDYWKTEAQFWKANCLSSNSQANRQDLADLGYWICESSFWRSFYKGKEGLSPSSIRQEINEAPYWRCEYSHLSDSFQSFAKPDKPHTQTASPPPLLSLCPSTAYLMSDTTSIPNPKVFRLQNPPPGRTPPLHCPRTSAGNLRRSARIQAKERKTTQTTDTAADAAAAGSAKVIKARVGKERAKRGRQRSSA